MVYLTMTVAVVLGAAVGHAMGRGVGPTALGSLAAALAGAMVGVLTRTGASLWADRATAVSLGVLELLVVGASAVVAAGLLHWLSALFASASSPGLLACRPALLGIVGGLCGALLFAPGLVYNGSR